jgi:RimJ/RimL family protein N-acetyltransferase
LIKERIILHLAQDYRFMDLPVHGTATRCLPRGFVSKSGLPCELQLLPTAAGHRLVEMYLAFQPRSCFQGLPPIKDAVCINWVYDMLRTGVSIIAVAGNDCIVGHTALFPINQQKCEMLVVVCPGFQNIGVGTRLVQCCIDLADELGFQRIWLPVDATNVRARHVYRKCGFEYVSNTHGREMDMACEVRRWRSASSLTPPVPAPHFSLTGAPINLVGWDAQSAGPAV